MIFYVCKMVWIKIGSGELSLKSFVCLNGGWFYFIVSCGVFIFSVGYI